MRQHNMRQYNGFDRLLGAVDNGLRTLIPGSTLAQRSMPGQERAADLDVHAARQSASLMRVNHSGEVCAQALYQGQALTARLPNVRQAMEQAAREEQDHLAWCETRLRELNSHPSLLNPLWYGLSYAIGAAAGLAGDKVSLGFVAETEKQVEAHLASHLRDLPSVDLRSRAIVSQMQQDEAHHRQQALAAGGQTLPLPVQGLMRLVAMTMTKTSHYI